MSRAHKSTPLCRRLLRQLVADHGVRFKTPIEDCWIARVDGAIIYNTRNGMDCATWFIGVDRVPDSQNTCGVGRPLVWHPRWNRPGAECGYVECTIESADPISKLVKEPFFIAVGHGRLSLARGNGSDYEI